MEAIKEKTATNSENGSEIRGNAPVSLPVPWTRNRAYFCVSWRQGKSLKPQFKFHTKASWSKDETVQKESITFSSELPSQKMSEMLVNGRETWLPNELFDNPHEKTH